MENIEDFFEKLFFPLLYAAFSRAFQLTIHICNKHRECTKHSIFLVFFQGSKSYIKTF